MNEFSFSWGSTESRRKYFGQRNCDYCPGGDRSVPVSDDSDVGINYPYLFPGTKLDPDKIPNVSLQGFTAINNAAYPGSWNDFVFLWADNVTKITGNHAFKAGVSIERSGMNDRIQLSFAQAPATTNQNGSFRFTDRAPAARRATASPTRCSAVRRLHRVREQAEHEVAGDGLRRLRPGQLEADHELTIELGLRYSLWQPWGRRTGDGVVPAAVLQPATAPVDRSARRLRRQRRPLQRRHAAGDAPTDEALAEFPQLANLQRLYHGVPNGFAETRRTASSRVWDGLRAQRPDDVPRRRRPFLNRVQINTTAAYGFNAPLSEMQTVINGNVDAPGGASTRNFPLVGAMQSPDFTNPTSWAWNATLDRELPWQMRGSASYVGRSASTSSGRATSTSCSPARSSEPRRERQRAPTVPRLRQHHAL
jgi:hypothetical protein